MQYGWMWSHGFVDGKQVSAVKSEGQVDRTQCLLRIPVSMMITRSVQSGSFMV
jgi:hypothetical protein